MKYRFFIVGLAMSAMVYAQKKELRKVEKALDRKNYSEASQILSTIEENSLEEKYKADYDYYRAAVFLESPKNVDASIDLFKNSIKLLNSAKTKGYDKVEDVDDLISVATNSISSKAQEMLNTKNLEGAADAVIYLTQLDSTNLVMKENAANLSYQIGDYDTARRFYVELLDKEYTGITSTILADNKENGQLTSFSDMEAAKIAVKSGGYINAREETTESKLGSMVTTLAYIYKQQNEDEKAKKLVTDMVAKYPNDDNLNLSKADLYLMLGDTEMYEKTIKSLKEEVKDPLVFQNLGIAAAEKQNWDQAIEYYIKSIELDPDSYVSQNNIAAAYINKGNLESTSVDQQIILYTKATNHFEKVVELKPELVSAKQSLLGLYEFLEMTEKATALKAKM